MYTRFGSATKMKIKQVILIAILSIVCHKVYRFWSFTGYARLNLHLDEQEPGKCAYKYKNLESDTHRKPILNTLDADIFPNGICMFSSGDFYPFVKSTRDSSLRANAQNELKSSLFMLDMNYLDVLDPVALKIVDKEYNRPTVEFNLFSISAYQDENSNFKLITANYRPDTNVKSIEMFTYDTLKRVMVHSNTYRVANSSDVLSEMCDLVMAEDYLVYFTKCHSDGGDYKAVKFGVEVKSGEIWLINLRENVLYRVARGLFMPKSIAYLRSEELIVVTNLAQDGMSIFRKEKDFSLTKVQDIRLDSFVFNIHIDLDNNLWLTLYPKLYQTFNLAHVEKYFIDKSDLVASELVKVTLSRRNKHDPKYEYTVQKHFSTNGKLFNFLGSSIYHNQNLVLFSLLNDPKVCNL